MTVQLTIEQKFEEFQKMELDDSFFVQKNLDTIFDLLEYTDGLNEKLNQGLLDYSLVDLDLIFESGRSEYIKYLYIRGAHIQQGMGFGTTGSYFSDLYLKLEDQYKFGPYYANKTFVDILNNELEFIEYTNNHAYILDRTLCMFKQIIPHIDNLKIEELVPWMRVFNIIELNTSVNIPKEAENIKTWETELKQLATHLYADKADTIVTLVKSLGLSGDLNYWMSNLSDVATTPIFELPEL